jgi:hypothetical protein
MPMSMSVGIMELGLLTLQDAGLGMTMTDGLGC